MDEFDVGAITDTDAAANSVAENAAVGTLVGITASASDADATTNAITYSLDDDAGGRFAINAGSGVVTVAGALDREAAASHGIMVRATSADGSFSTQGFTIAVIDVDEFDVGAISDTDAAANSVAENAAVGTLVGITASATDADATTNTITYIAGRRRRRALRHRRDNGRGHRGRARWTAKPRPATTSWCARPRPTAALSTQGFTIAVTDVDEFDVGRDQRHRRGGQRRGRERRGRHAGGHHRLGQRRGCHDQRHHLHAGRRCRGRFAIDAEQRGGDGGRCAGPRGAASHTITVRATSADGSFCTQAFTIDVDDVDEFDVGAVTDTDAAANAVAENAAVGTLVGITASAATPMPPPTPSPTRWTTTPGDASRSTRPPGW